MLGEEEEEGSKALIAKMRFEREGAGRVDCRISTVSYKEDIVTDFRGFNNGYEVYGSYVILIDFVCFISYDVYSICNLISEYIIVTKFKH